MKKIYLLAAALVVLAGCQGGDKNTPVDVHTFGMKGDVKEVLRSVMVVSGGEELDDPWLEVDEEYMAFDKEGRVLRDDNYSTYEYDDAGNFIMGLSRFSKVTRDAKGRIIKYSNDIFSEDGELLDEDADVFEYCEYEYEYDAQGRRLVEKYAGWEWGTTYKYEYEGNNIYPSHITFEGYNEGWIDKGTIDYEYLKFDAVGNWIERQVTLVYDSYEEPWEDDMEPEIETETQVKNEFLTIKYWRDEE